MRLKINNHRFQIQSSGTKVEEKKEKSGRIDKNQLEQPSKMAYRDVKTSKACTTFPPDKMDLEDAWRSCVKPIMVHYTIGIDNYHQKKQGHNTETLNNRKPKHFF